MGQEDNSLAKNPRKLKQARPSKKSPGQKLDELASLKLLYDLSVRIVSADNLSDALDEILGAGMRLSGADMGCIQVFDEYCGLKVKAQHGFQQSVIDFFNTASGDRGFSCHTALTERQRIFVGDVSQCPISIGTPSMAVLEEAGVRALHNTPLVSRKGQLVGILNVYYRRTVREEDLDLRFFDLLAGQAADIIVQTLAQQALLRESEKKYYQLFNSIDQGFFLIDMIFDDNDQPIDMYYVEANAAATRILGLDYTGKRLREIDPNYEEYWYEIFGRVSLTGESIRMEQYAEPDKKWYSFYVFKVGGSDSRRIGNIFLDITERKDMEKELHLHRESLARLVEEQIEQWKRTQRHYQTLVSNAPMKFAIFDRYSRYIYRTPRLTDYYGNTNDHVLGKAWWDLGIPESEWRPWQEKFDAVLATHSTVTFETKYPDETGAFRDLLVHVVPEISETGEVESLLTFAADITERKQMENELQQHRDNLEQLVMERTEQLRRSETLYRTLVENLPVVISRYDKELRYIYRSPQGDGDTADLDSKEMRGKTWAEYGIPEKVYSPWQKLLTGVLETGRPVEPVEYETSYPDQDGEARHYLVRVVADTGAAGQVESLLSVSLDITERKRNQELLNAVLEGMKDGFYILDPELRFIYVNQGMGRIWGLSPEVLIGQKITSVFPGIIEYSLEKFRQALATQTPQDYEVRSRVINRWVHMHIYPFREEIAVFCLDIEDHKQTMEALSQSEERFGKIFNTSPVMIVIIRMTDNQYVEVNQKFLDVIEYTRDEAIGRTPQELGLWSVDAEKGEKLLTELWEKGEYHNAEFKITTKTGKIVTTLTSSLFITFNGEQCRLATMQDITKEQQMEDDLLRLDRLNLIGEMAACISHEIRNPLTTVRGYLQMIGQKDKQFKSQFGIMIDELDRANAIITEFLSLAKNRPIERSNQKLNDIIESIRPLMEADAVSQDKSIITELSENIPWAYLDAKEIRQLILNLVRNGLDAIEPGKLVYIRTYAKENKLVLAVQDEGKGIPEHIYTNLGMPFNTSKENGTGLGLPVCYRIIERHEAVMNVHTGPEGTEFIISFHPVKGINPSNS